MNYIKVDQDQINITREDRIKSKCLKYTITCLNVRKLLGIELEDLLSELVKLIGEFSEEGEYEITMKYIEKENTNDIRTQL